MPQDITSLRQEIKKAASQEAAIEILTKYIEANPASDEALTLRGMKYWGLGKRSLALNDYLAAIKINPQSKAHMALQAATDILDYRNKDLYNP